MSEGPFRQRGLPVPATRLSRLTRFGGMATGIAGGAMLRGARELAVGRRPTLRDMLLTPATATRLADELARMRGAAMKVGQLLSMETGDLLPPELADILARLRAEAHFMPPAQLKTVLEANWGQGFQRRFARFDVRPVAAASIGQVHRAVLPDGRALAVKVQYPGVRRSIDSDVANVGALIRLSGLAPKGFDLKPLLDEARRQLHEEADYPREALYLARYGALLAGDADFAVPEPAPEFTTPDILAMSFLEGVALETLADAPQAERDRVATALIALVLREVFDFGLIQTDPNFANYRYEPGTGRIQLLDFGAAREAPAAALPGLRRLLAAGLAGARDRVMAESAALGLIDPTAGPAHLAEIADMAEMAFAPLRTPGTYDFAADGLAQRLRARGFDMAMAQDHWHIPPMDLLYLQRKVAGMYLLAVRLRARVDLHALVAPLAAPDTLPVAPRAAS